MLYLEAWWEVIVWEEITLAEGYQDLESLGVQWLGTLCNVTILHSPQALN